MARKKKHEEHQNHEAWAIPYGDLVTLLFALFTVMYAMSSVNEGKYRVLSDSLVAAFRGSPKTDTPITTEKDSSGKGGDRHLSGMRPTALMKLRDPKPERTGGYIGEKGAGSDESLMKGSRGQDASGQALYQMADEVKGALQGLIDQGLVHIRQTPNSLEVEIKTDILFQSGVAKVQPSAVPVLQTIAAILKPFPNALRVEGHTDNRPISTAAFPSNWELSAARAANVVELFAKSGVDPLRMQVLGLGEFRPAVPNDTQEGRNTNRRVVVVVLENPPVNGVQDPVDAAITQASVPATPGPTVLIQNSNVGKNQP